MQSQKIQFLASITVFFSDAIKSDIKHISNTFFYPSRLRFSYPYSFTELESLTRSNYNFPQRYFKAANTVLILGQKRPFVAKSLPMEATNSVCCRMINWVVIPNAIKSCVCYHRSVVQKSFKHQLSRQQLHCQCNFVVVICNLCTNVRAGLIGIKSVRTAVYH